MSNKTFDEVFEDLPELDDVNGVVITSTGVKYGSRNRVLNIVRSRAFRKNPAEQELRTTYKLLSDECAKARSVGQNLDVVWDNGGKLIKSAGGKSAIGFSVVERAFDGRVVATCDKFFHNVDWLEVNSRCSPGVFEDYMESFCPRTLRAEQDALDKAEALCQKNEKKQTRAHYKVCTFGKDNKEIRPDKKITKY